MGDRTGIEWTDATWNPLRGCSRVSEGCRNCYAERVAARFSWAAERGATNVETGEIEGGRGAAPYHGLATAKGWTGVVRLVEEHLADPLCWRKPRRIFVNSMSDLFHERVPDEWIDRVFAVMALAPRHTFQVLTKRPERMRAYLIDEMRTSWRVAYEMLVLRGDRMEGGARSAAVQDGTGWPLRNVHLGVSVEDQATADARIPLLLQTPAAVRFISYEPALGPVDFGLEWMGTAPDAPDGIDWIIVGGESGPGARPFDVAWARSTIAACAAAGVPCFVKQLGAEPRTTDGDQLEWPRLPGDEEDPHRAGPAPGGGQWWTIPAVMNRKGGDQEEWPADLRVRQFPTCPEAVRG